MEATKHLSVTQCMYKTNKKKLICLITFAICMSFCMTCI